MRRGGPQPPRRTARPRTGDAGGSGRAGTTTTACDDREGPSALASEYGPKRCFDGEAARLLGGRIRARHPGFDVEGYAAEAERRVPGKELKGRVPALAGGLRPGSPRATPPPCRSSWPPSVMNSRGATARSPRAGSSCRWPCSWRSTDSTHPELHLDAIEAITRRHTGEYAVRPHLVQHRARTLKRVAESARSPSHNVRRLASEGIRPPAVGPHPRHPRPGLGAGLDIRGPLRSDPSEHVRKSVANNLDDIAGDHPGAVLATALRRLEKSPTPETGWTAKHGLRTLVKKGDRQAPALLGASGGEHVEVSRLPVTPRGGRRRDRRHRPGRHR